MEFLILNAGEAPIAALDFSRLAAYSRHMKITTAKAMERFRVFLRFDDGTSGAVDLQSLAGHGVFCAWLQPGVFEQLSISPVGALEWPGELDLCPDALYLGID